MAKEKPNSSTQMLPGMDTASTMPDGHYSGDKPNPHLTAFLEENGRLFDADNDDYNVLSALVALNFSDFPVGVESGEGLAAARTKLRRVPHVAAMAGAVNYASARHIAKYFALGRKL